MHKGFLISAALLGALSVVFGAFAAHALKQKLTPDILMIFETGVRYQFYHALALLAVGILYKEFPSDFIRWSGNMFWIGILLFSGSLYFLTYVQASAQPGFKWVGVMTPLGGICFIIGWLFLVTGLAKKK